MPLAIGCRPVSAACAAESSAFEPLLSKVDSARLAQQAGLNVPDWVAVSSDEDIAAVDRLSFPVVIRPDTWTMPGSEVDKVELLEDFPSASERLSELVDHGTSVVVSEFVTAPVEAVEFGILWRSLSGTATVVCTGRKRRQDGSGGGVMAWGEAVDLPDVRQEAMRFLDTSGFQGVGGIEFICSGGKLWFIEFNPRLEAIHFLGTRAGVDTVCLAYRDAALDERPTQQPVQVAATAWVGSAWAHRLRIDPGDWRLALRDRVAFARSQRRVRAVLSGRDPMPTLALGAHLAGKAWARLRR
ncbi:MAG: ATP-grasp domain-containing protein [Candidatus Microthrix sp.]|nr:ATP-grasp domain-containing protein [Candidatus Microthrix sp.]MBK7324204.1 ATP-grasp domain-containing protein [Candidatus Microthrix sp.]